jgi:hypothetical protein
LNGDGQEGSSNSSSSSSPEVDFASFVCLAESTLSDACTFVQHLEQSRVARACAQDPVAAAGLALVCATGTFGVQLRVSKRSRELARDALLSAGMVASVSAMATAAVAGGSLLVLHRHHQGFYASNNNSSSSSSSSSSLGTGDDDDREEQPSRQQIPGENDAVTTNASQLSTPRPVSLTREGHSQDGQEVLLVDDAPLSPVSALQWWPAVGERGGLMAAMVEKLKKCVRWQHHLHGRDRLQSCMRVIALALLFTAVGRGLEKARSWPLAVLRALMASLSQKKKQQKRGLVGRAALGEV